MPSTSSKYSLKNLRNRYRLTITNEDTFEEIVAFKMGRWTVYVIMSLIFMLLVGITIILIAFTPLKFYIPGYGVPGSASEFETLKRKTDSLENVVKLQEQYSDGIKKILTGEEISKDTTLDSPRPEILKLTRKKKRK